MRRGHPVLRGARRGEGAQTSRVTRVSLWLLAAALLVPVSARADEYRGATMVASIDPPILDAIPSMGPAKPRDKMSSVFRDSDQVAPTELAAERGGATSTVPILSAPQTVPQIILWDELKAQLPGGGNQGTNQIQIR